ncbi:hypothetical protein M413DRAFT_76264 [Hebeloma cylindrosporum]|uniref:Lysine-specific metallo-endopeptidase domain-containing protein n=1 Tax=Hebeloma cylindrosporum TaxID=76867 RepID=A0A0C2YB47_HEBCY|nr:hypothetical protein M413DRAFT_76264 [Hebeloma cylindrosporum h7]
MICVLITSPGPDAIDSVEHLKIVATVTNTGDETLKVLNDPHGTLNKLSTDTFVIANAKGAQPSFMGIKLKYVPKTAADLEVYTILAPGESVAVEHDLAYTYNFTASGAAKYEIRARNLFHIVNADSTISTLRADADSHSANISGKLAAARPALVKRATYSGCTSFQERLIVSAALAAQKYTYSALNYASAHASATPRYTTWFGAYKVDRYKTVLSHYTNINSHDFLSYEFDCTCTEVDTYAYVYPDQFGVIYLCRAFWNAPMTGTDSKASLFAGTLVHESSHFTQNGGAQDHEYGQLACELLSRINPTEAVDNASSHEYFAENNPALA